MATAHVSRGQRYRRCESLRATGRPIVGGSVLAMERGPVLGEVYDLIRGRHRQMPLRDAFVGTNRFNVELVADPDVGELSRYEIEMLQQVAKRHAADDEWELTRQTHEFAEWQKNNPGQSVRSIPLHDVLDREVPLHRNTIQGKEAGPSGAATGSSG